MAPSRRPGFGLAISMVMTVVSIICMAAAGPARAQGYLHRVHMRIVDGQGVPIELRGVDVGGWLNFQDYMYLLPGQGDYLGTDNDPKDPRPKVLSLVAPDKAEQFFAAVRDNWFTEHDVKLLKGWGFNSVMIPLDFRLLYDQSSGANMDTAFVYLDRLLDWCAAAHIYVFVDLHTVPGGTNRQNPNTFFDNTDREAMIEHIWQRIAARYADNPWIGGWDLLNEPHCEDQGHVLLGERYRDIAAAIRQVDKHHLLVLEGDYWAQNLDEIGIGNPTAPLWDDNVAYSDHLFGRPLHERPDAGGAFSPYSLPEHRALAARLDVPLWVGSYGVNSNVWINAMKTQFEHPDPLLVDGHRVDTPAGWCLWAYKGGYIALMTNHLPASTAPLQAWWGDSSKPKPSPYEAFTELMAVADSLAFKACTVNPDVVDALTRKDFPTRSVPYPVAQSIPGKIVAVYYDMGNEGVAYHDTVSTDEAGQGCFGRLWNDGSSFRNDGVDVYPDGDDPPGYVIGGIIAGEWVNYTVNCKPGEYTLSVRYSAETPSSHMRVLLNGADVAGSIDLPVTGDWHQYQTITVPRVTVSVSGTSTLKLAFDTGGYNIDWVDFAPRR